MSLTAGRFRFKDHEYEREILTSNAQRKVEKKGSQLGISEAEILKTMHGLLFGVYPQGALYLFPSEKDVYDFSRARFNPLLIENPDISKHVQQTESITLKKVNKSMLYLRGARATSKIEGTKKMASQLISIPVDRIVFDERDLMEDEMVELALTRLGHSAIKEEVYLGTPSLPDFGVSKLYDESDQRVWEIKCQRCGKGTVLELEFPECIRENGKGTFIRACKNCHEEIYTRDGRWVAQVPSVKDLEGRWISRLNSSFEDPGNILKKFLNPKLKNRTEFYNSYLAMGYVETENRLSQQDVYNCCGQDLMPSVHTAPCAMGVDIGAMLNVVIAKRKNEKQLEIVKLARVSSFNDVHDLAKRFGVQCAVIDIEPELRKAREFAEAEPYACFLCDYDDNLTGNRWDEQRRILKVNRTETLDASHYLVTLGNLCIPRRNEEVEIFAKQCSNTAKVLQEDPETGSRVYRYRKLGDDHYRHALGYMQLASERIQIWQDSELLAQMLLLQEKKQDGYNPLTYGLPISN